ncbi:MAG: response regulator, partial [Saprospiraceae bacterium]
IKTKKFDNRLLPEAMAKVPRLIFAQEDKFDPDIVWIGTWDGLLRWRLSDNSVKIANINQNRPEPVFCMAQTERGVLWLGAQQGLFRYNYQTGEIKIYTQADGLPALEFNRNTTAVMPDGMIIMGTTNGSICFYPEEMLVREIPRYMAISGVQLGTEKLPIIRQNTGYAISPLPYGSENLTVYFSLLDFTNMKTAQYRFRLSAGDDEWVPNGLKNSVSLAGLSPGKYTLEVQGSLNGSEWSESEWLYFEVENPWWKTWWATIGFTLLVGIPSAWIVRNKRLLAREKYQNDLLRLEVEYENTLTKTKERILTNVAHDLRTPLTLITGLAERIGGDSDEKILKAADTIKYQSQELLNMINQILDLGRIRELGSIPLSPALLELEQFLSVLLESYSYQAQEKSIRLHKRLSADIPAIFIDENGLRAILGNLLSNALKFTPNGGKILLEVFVEDENIHILVRDSGPGIPIEKVKFLFQRYYQIDGEKYPGGVGIGLAYASEMADLMGGRLAWAPPMLGTVTGAVFSVVFPLEKLRAPQMAIPESPIRVETAPVSGARAGDQRPLILVVEDRQAMADYIRAILETEYDVVTASDGRIGFENTLELIPDLVISDVLMPSMSGIELCKAIKNDIRTSHIPVILLSAKSSNAAVRAGLSSGASLYLIKPFDHEILKKYVANSLLISAQTKQFFESAWGDAADKTSETKLPEGISREKEDLFIREVETLIDANFADENFTVEKMAAALHISVSQLRRKIAALGGESAGVLLRKYRLTKAREMLLEKPDTSISEIAFACGFSDPNYFSTLFGKEYGMTPRQFRGSNS